MDPATGTGMNVWHILGAGSIGRLFAARYERAGIAAVLLRRDTPPPATPPARLLVATKAPDTVAALAPLLAADGDGQLLLLLQNGMGTSEAVRARWPRVRLWNAVTTAAAWRDADDRLQVVSEGKTLAGRWDDAGDPAADDAVAALATAGLLTVTGDIRGALWRKLAVNALINPLSALHGCRNGELETRAAAELAALAAEFDAVAHAEGIALDALTLARTVMRSTAENFSSMNRDLAAGRPTEIDFITGYVAARAARHGIPVPHHERLLTAVRQRTPPGRPPGERA
ncbi:MAG: ketopantoate reductase family protein [Pseudomonadota bacterium]